MTHTSLDDRSVALVASPFQLLSLLEAIGCGSIEAPATVLTRGFEPAPLLALAGDLLDRSRVLSGQDVRTHVRHISRSRYVVAGDVYSSLVLAAAATSGRRRLTLLDDGAAMLRAADALGAAAPLLRAHSVRRHQHLFAALGAAGVARNARRGMVTIVTGLPLDEPTRAALRDRGYTVIDHGYAWSRRVGIERQMVFPADVRRVVIGSSLAHDGLLDVGYYLTWLRAALDGDGPVAFVAHRRELPEAIDLAGPAVACRGDDRLPVELLVRDFEGSLGVETLPSTAAITVPAIRGDRPTAMNCTLPPPKAMTARATSEMNGLLRRIDALAKA